MATIDSQTAGGKNRVALLDVIANSEIGPALLAIPETDNGYLVLVGATPQNPLTFSNFAKHPNIYNAQCGSTAAGRYQILYRWWVIYQKRLNLPDFSPLSQDKYALQQFKERGALPLIDAGNLKERWQNSTTFGRVCLDLRTDNIPIHMHRLRLRIWPQGNPFTR